MKMEHEADLDAREWGIWPLTWVVVSDYLPGHGSIKPYSLTLFDWGPFLSFWLGADSHWHWQGFGLLRMHEVAA